MVKNKCIMVVTAHPDDETYCSGTIAKLAQSGNTITVVVATSGNRGSDDPSVLPHLLAEQRRKEMDAAARRLGVQTVIWMGHEDGQLDTISDLKEQVYRLIRQHQPDIVFTFDPWKRYDFHPDHRTIGFVTTEAVFLHRCCWYYPQHMEEGLKSSKSAELYLFQPEEPNYQVDVVPFMETKLAAAIEHVSQREDPDIQRMMSMHQILQNRDQSAASLVDAFSPEERHLWQDLSIETFRKVSGSEHNV